MKAMMQTLAEKLCLMIVCALSVIGPPVVFADCPDQVPFPSACFVGPYPACAGVWPCVDYAGNPPFAAPQQGGREVWIYNGPFQCATTKASKGQQCLDGIAPDNNIWCDWKYSCLNTGAGCVADWNTLQVELKIGKITVSCDVG